MKFAVILTGWNAGYLRFTYEGIAHAQREFHDEICAYTCFAQLGTGSSYDKSDFMFYQLADLSAYDGILFISTTVKEGTIKNQVHDWILKSGKPCVTLEEELPRMSSVGFDQWSAMRELVDHLVQKHGIKTFGFLDGPKASSEAQARKQAVEDCVREYGLTMAEEWVRSGTYRFEDGVAYGKRLCDMFSEGAQLPQAVLCSNDLMALGIIETIKDTPVFDQIAVTGFDRYLEGEIYYPSLTTIARPKESVAYEGIKLLRELVLGGQTEPIHKNLDYQLYVGQSCGCQEPDYFDNKLFRCQSFERMHGEEEILAKLHSMEERIASEVSIEQIMEAIQIFLKRIDASAGQVYLENDILSGVACDYKQCRRLALDWSNDNCTDEIRVVMPLHYQQHQMGYCVMTGIGALFRYGVQENFFRSVSYALENCIQRLRYQDVNHRLQRLYRIDQLTEIYNRFGMEDKGQQFYHKNCMQHMNTIFIFCDINRLKYINDTYGHEAGDWVIRATGKALAKLQSEVSLPFRIGGDEFILLTTENSGVNEEVIRQSITEEGEEAPIDGVVEVSIGAVVAPWNEPEDLDRYLSKADEAMYEEKKRFHETYYDERRMERRKEQR